jgi:transketolase
MERGIAMNRELENRCINTIRILSADAVQYANAGHPGMPMGAAAMAYTLWTGFLKHNPQNPQWFDRDRFVLSAGHGSMLHLLVLTRQTVPHLDRTQAKDPGVARGAYVLAEADGGSPDVILIGTGAGSLRTFRVHGRSRRGRGASGLGQEHRSR